MDIADWLRTLGLERYEQAFRDHEIDAEVLPRLTPEDLTALGVIAIGHRRKLLDAIAALRAGAAGEAERRQLTVLFSDLVGSTELAGRLDPEELGAVIGAYHRSAASAVERLGGQVAKYLGDGVLAYFGYPRAHEDDAERAVRAALAIQGAIAGLAAPEPLAARIGIATGLVVVGELVGEGAAREQAVVGQTPNLAARLQALAGPGQVLVAGATADLLAGGFDLVDLGPQRLKGFTEPERALRVERERPATARFEARRARGLSPLVGREAELALLERSLREAWGGSGRAVLLSGEPGIGKSRLVQALCERHADAARSLVHLHCSPHHGHSPLHPLLEELARAAGFGRDDDGGTRIARLESVLAGVVDREEEAVALLAPLFGLAPARGAALELSARERKERTLEALCARIEGLAARAPLLVLLEDAHWSDPTTLELLTRLIERIERRPILLVVTFRAEFQPPWQDGPLIRISLDRLGREQAAALIGRVCGGRILPEDVLEAIVARTDGVPLFVEELTKTVLESGWLRDQGGRLVADSPLPPFAIPATLHDSLMARLDRLAPIKEVAQTAAVIGRWFSRELLAAVVALDGARLDQAFERLVEAELIRVDGAGYSFKHALVQDAAYQSLLRSRRQRLHARIAWALRERFADIASGEPELVAHHLSEAGLAGDAVIWWQRASERAAERSAHREAIAHIERALAPLRDLPESDDAARLEMRLQNTLGVALMATRGPVPEATAAHARARALAERLSATRERYAAVWGLWYQSAMGMRYEDARGLAGELLAVAERERDEELVLEAHHANWPTLYFLGDFRGCVAHAEKGCGLYDPEAHGGLRFRYGGHDPGVCARSYGGIALWFLGLPDRALATARDGVRLAERLEHPLSLVIALSHAAELHQLRREPGAARACAVRMEAACAERGIAPHFRAIAAIMRAWAGSANDPQQAAAAIREQLAVLRRLGFEGRRPYYLCLLAEAELLAGRADAAHACLDEALELAEVRDDRSHAAELHRLRGEVLLVLTPSNPSGAEPCFRRALEVARAQSAGSLELRAATGLARLWATQGRRGEAHDLLAPIYGRLTEGLATADPKDAKALLDRLA